MKPVAHRIAVFTPHGSDDTFWTLFTGMMSAAGDDLGLELTVSFAEDSRERMREQIRTAVKGPERADAVVFQSFKQAGRAFLEIADEAGVPAFLVNAGLGEEAHRSLGGPRGELRSWIGEMLPDDYGAGRMLADALVDRARQRGLPTDADGRVHMIALEGVVSDGASIERLRGLRDAVAARDDVVLDQVIPANWRKDAAALRTRILLHRYPKAAVIWAANDPMALGAVEAVRATGRTPGRNVLVGGVDWTSEALDAIEAGTLEFSVGGHFMEGAWVAVLLHDYLNGHDFADQATSFRSPMSLVDQERLAQRRALVRPETWDRADFRALSRHLNPEPSTYAFGPDHLLPVTEAAGAGPSPDDR